MRNSGDNISSMAFLNIEKETSAITKRYQYGIQLIISTQLSNKIKMVSNTLNKEQQRMNNKQKILIVDDEVKIVEILQAYLEKAGYTAIPAFDGASALLLEEKQRPDLILLDLMLPDLMGEEVCRRIRKKRNVPIIMLTARVAESEMIAGLRCGADDYIPKPFSPRIVVARVQAVLRRAEGNQVENGEKQMGNGYLTVDLASKVVRKQGQEIHLTPTEFRILELFLNSPGRVFSREQIISYALGDQFEGYDRSVDTYIKSLRQKVEPVPGSPRYITTVYGMGYKLNP